MTQTAPSRLRKIQATRHYQRPWSSDRSAWLFGPGRRLYVVKGRSFPCPLTASATEAYCWTLCRALGLSTPNAVAIDPRPLRLAGTRYQFHDDLLYGSEVPYRDGTLFDQLPHARLAHVSNRKEQLGWPAFDFWVANAKPGRAVYVLAPDRSLRALKISHRQCFRWDPMYGEETAPTVIADYGVEPGQTDGMLSVLEAIEELASRPEELERLARHVPRQFGDRTKLMLVVPTLRARAALLRPAVESLLKPSVSPQPPTRARHTTTAPMECTGIR